MKIRPSSSSSQWYPHPHHHPHGHRHPHHHPHYHSNWAMKDSQKGSKPSKPYLTTELGTKTCQILSSTIQPTQTGTIWRPLRRLSHSSLNTWVSCPLPPNTNEKTPIKVDKTQPPKSMETRTVLDLAIIATPQNTLHISCYTLPLSSSSGKWRFI